MAELARVLSMTDSEIEHRKKMAGLGSEDIPRLVSLAEVITPRVDDYTQAFFQLLAQVSPSASLFGRREVLEEAKRLKRRLLLAMVGGEYGRAYVELRIALGTHNAGNGVEMRAFLAAYHHLLRMIGSDIIEHFADDPAAAFERFASVQKIAFFDIGIGHDVFFASRQSTISAQQAAILELSTPVLQVRDRLLVLPIIGMLDSHRAKQLTDGLLQGIRSNRAKVVVMDITGVAAVDSRVASHLLQTVAAARLMGSTVIVTGLSAEVAQSLVALGVDLAGVNTMADLQAGLEEAERILGYRVVRTGEAAPFAQLA